MANNNNDTTANSQDRTHESELDQSFVGKFVSGLLSNTPLSKWFGRESPKNRKRNDQDEDDSFLLQPPSKRAKLPNNNYQTPQSSNNAQKVFYNFLEPVPGPSGLDRQMPINAYSGSTLTISSQENLSNGRDSESSEEESTSGYSSQVKKIDKIIEESTIPKTDNSFNTKSLFTLSTDRNNIRSLFTERSLSPGHHTVNTLSSSLSSRRPTFNATTFGSANFIDKTLSTQQILNSPFYNGRTTYYGASAYGRRLGQSLEQTSMIRNNSIQIKPKNQINDNTTLSKTARRILTTLEQYSSPINDAKKIPIAPKRMNCDSLLGKYTGANPYLKKRSERKAFSNNKELQVPSIPELIQMKEKERLQNITESVRQIAATSKSTLNKEVYKLGNCDNNDLKEQPKHRNKMKNSIISSIRQQKISSNNNTNKNNETILGINLPQISLPITTLPKFDLTVPLPPLSQNNNTDKQIEYKFSNPLIIAENLKKSIIAVNNFKFSEPLSKKPKRSDDSKHKNNGELMKFNDENPNNLLDKFKPLTSTWECSTCLVRNQSDTMKCIACEIPKSKSPQIQNTFGDQFKLNDKWECQSCLVRNNKNETKCVACNTSKTDLLKPLQFQPANDSRLIRDKNYADDKCVTCETSKSEQIEKDFGSKFKLSKDTWECPVCMIRNKNDLSKCAACETAKIVKGNNLWECKTCLIKNASDLLKCSACTMPKDNNNNKKAAEMGFGDKFKIKSDNWECCSCLVRNENDCLICTCCGVPKPTDKLPEISQNKSVLTFNFGVNKTNEFKFGIPVNAQKPDVKTSTVASSVFGEKAKKVDQPITAFSFGIKPETDPLLKSNKKLPEEVAQVVSTLDFKPDIPEKIDKIKQIPKFDFKRASYINGDLKTDEKLTNLFSTPVTTQANIQPATPPTFKFGTSDQTNGFNSIITTTEKPFVFGNNEQSNNKMFTFSGQSNCSTNTSTTATAATTTNTFKFGASNITTAVPSFNFAPNFNFANNEKNESIVFSDFTGNDSKNGTFNFGSSMTNNNNQKAVFSFGASQTNSVAPIQQPSQSGFNFGTASLPQTGAFNFSGPPPSFNFTDGNANANTGQPGPQRKIRKALRRTHR